MKHQQDTPLLRCEHCGVEATGMDEQGDALCDRHAGMRHGERLARAEHVGTMICGAIAAARATGLDDMEIFEIVRAELAGDYICRLEEDVLRGTAPTDGGGR